MSNIKLPLNDEEQKELTRLITSEIRCAAAARHFCWSCKLLTKLLKRIKDRQPIPRKVKTNAQETNSQAEEEKIKYVIGDQEKEKIKEEHQEGEDVQEQGQARRADAVQGTQPSVQCRDQEKPAVLRGDRSGRCRGNLGALLGSQVQKRDPEPPSDIETSGEGSSGECTNPSDLSQAEQPTLDSDLFSG